MAAQVAVQYGVWPIYGSAAAGASIYYNILAAAEFGTLNDLSAFYAGGDQPALPNNIASAINTVSLPLLPHARKKKEIPPACLGGSTTTNQAASFRSAFDCLFLVRLLTCGCRQLLIYEHLGFLVTKFILELLVVLDLVKMVQSIFHLEPLSIQFLMVEPININLQHPIHSLLHKIQENMIVLVFSYVIISLPHPSASSCLRLHLLVEPSPIHSVWVLMDDSSEKAFLVEIDHGFTLF